MTCSRCGAGGQFTRQRQPWGLEGVCDECWKWNRANAWRLYRAARRWGTLRPAHTCFRCGHGGRKIAGHHFDYRRPFAVLWLCTACHAREHRVSGKGRCAGCQATGPVRKMERHVAECPEWARLYREGKHPLEPAAEQARWESEDKAAEREARVAESIAEVDAYRAAQAARFATPRDFLED